MHISNIRCGFANNSSSSHSIIIIKDKSKRPINDYEYTGDYNFGWEYFTLATTEAKKHYLCAHLFQELRKTVGTEMAAIVTSEIVGDKEFIKHAVADLEDAAQDDIGYMYGIDHQSVMVLPRRYRKIYSGEPEQVDLVFFREYMKQVLREDVVILGGNDNDGVDHPVLSLSDAGLPLPLPKDTDHELICRKDKQYGFWTLFNRCTGCKVRFAWDDTVKIEKATTPELVDVKITDYCPFACSFCYMASTVQGKHATLESIDSLIRELSNLEVFEVALGGGEPTMHPNFAEILDEFGETDIIPNFTTKSVKWLKNNEITDAVKKNCKSIAFSVTDNYDDFRDMKTLHRWIKENASHISITAQVVMGIMDRSEFNQRMKDILEEEHIPITLLGFKEVGRGKYYVYPKGQRVDASSKHYCAKVDYSWWFDDILNLTKDRYCRIGIDTKLAEEYEHLLNANVKKELFHTDEGKFSMYIDLVDGKVGKSSYHKLESYKALTQRDIVTFFSRW
jgi:organic radical activating enzyme